MQTAHIGSRAEWHAAEYLTAHGYDIIARNWRRRECEIDIVAIIDGRVHFVEVKYRGSDVAGSGLEYIGPAKLRRMQYAARRWVAENDWHGEFVLSAVEVSGPEYDITAFIESADL
jgi:putative endonuclease